MRWRCSSSCVTFCLHGVDLLPTIAAETISALTVVCPVSRSSTEVYGNQDRVVLVLADAALSVRRQRADHA